MQVRREDGIYAEVDEAVRSGRYHFIIGGSHSALEREAETQKMFQLLGLPAIQTLAQIMNPVQSAQFLVWSLNRMNINGTSQIEEMLRGNKQLQDIARQLGVQEQNIPQFQQDVQQYVADNIGNIGRQFAQEQLNNYIQNGGTQ
jgi:hypothetical protein